MGNLREQLEEEAGKKYDNPKRARPGREQNWPLLSDPRGVVVVIRGGVSYMYDPTLKALEKALYSRLELDVVPFNYLGRQAGHPYDTRENIDLLRDFKGQPETLVGRLEEYVADIESQERWKDKPHLIAGHSMGGILCAKWGVAANSNLASIDRCVYLATPFDSPDGLFTVKSESVSAFNIEIPTFARHDLGKCCSNALVVRAEADGIFDGPKETSLSLNVATEQCPADVEQPFKDVDHFSICRDDKVIDHIVQTLGALVGPPTT